MFRSCQGAILLFDSHPTSMSPAPKANTVMTPPVQIQGPGLRFQTLETHEESSHMIFADISSLKKIPPACLITT